MITHPGCAPDGPGQGGKGDQIRLFHPEPPGEQVLISPEDQPVIRKILPNDIERFGIGDADPPPLPDGIAVQSLVLPQRLAPQGDNGAGGGRFVGEPLQKGSVVSVRHEAQILAVLLLGGGEGQSGGQGPGLLLAQIPQGEQCVGQLLLGHAIQHIALILFLIPRFFQQPPAGDRILFNAGIVPRTQIIIAQHLRPAEKPVEF